MNLTQLNHECLLHLFSFLDKDSRRALSLTCRLLRLVFLDPRLWTVLRFHSPVELTRDNFVLGASLRCLSVAWFSSRVLHVCNVEEWMKTPFQRDVCSRHQRLVSDFLARVCNMCPNLQDLTLSGCGHISDQDVVSVLRSCRRLRRLRLENCVRIGDGCLAGAAAHGAALAELTVDFCRNVSRAGLRAAQEARPQLRLSAERSADLIPDTKPAEAKVPLRRALHKVLLFS